MYKVKAKVRNKADRDHLILRSNLKRELVTDDHVLTGARPILRRGTHTKNEIPVVLSIPKNVQTIQNKAFSDFEELRHICFSHIPYNLGAAVFSNCAALETAELAEGTEKIPLECFANCRKLKHVKIPGTVKRINMMSFKNCSSLREITLPDGLQVIEIAAFSNCHALEKIIIPDSVTVIDDDAFANCTSLKKVYLPDSVKQIGACAFMNCTSLEEISIPPSVKMLPMGVFAGCVNLKRVLLPRTLEYIDPYAFYRCDRAEFPGIYEIEKPTLPMELLSALSGKISGTMLNIMGYPWFDSDKEYRISKTEYPGVLEVQSHYEEIDFPNFTYYDLYLANEKLEPLSDMPSLIHIPSDYFMEHEAIWYEDIKKAMRKAE